MAAVGNSKEADAARCGCGRHRHSTGVCPFCLRDRLSRLSSASMAAGANASASPSSSASSPCSSGEESVASSQVPPCGEARRARLGLLMRQEERETTAGLGAGRRRGQEEAPMEKKTTKRGNFWARLQQLHHGSWHRKDGCSLAHSKAAGEKSAAPKRAPLF